MKSLNFKAILILSVIWLGLFNSMNVSAKIDQDITFAHTNNYSFDPSEEIDPEATSTSGLPITYFTSDPNVAIVVNNKVRMVNVGNCDIYASQAGNETYNSAINSRPLRIYKGYQSVYFSLSPRYLGDGNYSPIMKSNSGLYFTFRSTNTAVATNNNNKIQIIAPGITYIAASNSGDKNWNPFYELAVVELNVSLPPTTLTSPWLFGNTGGPDAHGSVTQSNATTFNVTAKGRGIVDTLDQVKFVHTDIFTDGEIVVKVNSVSKNNLKGFAGIMIRTDMNEDSKFVMIGQRSDNQIFVNYRAAIGKKLAIANPTLVGGKTSPKYLKITRVGNEFGFYYTTNLSLGWTPVCSSITLTMINRPHIGFFTSSNDVATAVTANFSLISYMKSTTDENIGSPVVDSPKIEPTLEVYPNPAVEKVNIKGVTESTTISIFDMKGKMVYTTVTNSDLTISTNEIGKNGIYIIKINNTTKKLVIVQ